MQDYAWQKNEIQCLPMSFSPIRSTSFFSCSYNGLTEKKKKEEEEKIMCSSNSLTSLPKHKELIQTLKFKKKTGI